MSHEAPQPVIILSFEPDEVKRFEWLPFAIRYKLDVCGLRLSRAQWKAMPHEQRLRLLTQCVEGPAAQSLMAQAFVESGATEDELASSRTTAWQVEAAPDWLGPTLGIDAAEAGRRWVGASHYQRYLWLKIRSSRGKDRA